MNLEILSLDEAVKHFPRENSYAIRIGESFDFLHLNPLKENNNWIGINNYFFDDLWPSNWEEYSWYNVKNEEFQNYFRSQQRKYPKMTEESLMRYLESRGHFEGKGTLFNEKIARRILDDFEKVQCKVGSIIVHCIEGKNRAPAIGLAMNNIYGWGFEEQIKNVFPSYRRFIYRIMMDVSKKK